MILNKIKDTSLLKIIIPLSAVAIISRTFPEFSYFYYLLIPFFIVILLAGYKNIFHNKYLKKLLILLFFFGVWCAVTSLWSDYPAVTFSRSVFFIFISFGAVIAGYLWQQFKFNPVSFLIPANIVVISISLFSIITNIPSETWTGGNGKGLIGFAGHQNLLASAVLFTFPGVLSQKLDRRNPKMMPNYLLITLIILNLIILILTYSRGAVLSLVIGIFLFLILTRKWKIFLSSSVASIVILLMILIIPPLKNFSISLIKKDFPYLIYSREEIWEQSFKAAEEGGIFGLGYGISHPDILLPLEPSTGSHYINDRFIREKGSSFLALIEETGIAGLIIFLLPIVYLFKNLLINRRVANRKKTDSYITSLLTSSISVFFLHAQFEAWMIGVGSIQLPFYFFYLGGLTGLINYLDKS